jgi:hypothetical protein
MIQRDAERHRTPFTAALHRGQVDNPQTRPKQHLRLLAFGYIKEHVIDLGSLLISVTRAGYAALDEGPSAA